MYGIDNQGPNSYRAQSLQKSLWDFSILQALLQDSLFPGIKGVDGLLQLAYLWSFARVARPPESAKGISLFFADRAMRADDWYYCTRHNLTKIRQLFDG